MQDELTDPDVERSQELLQIADEAIGTVSPPSPENDFTITTVLALEGPLLIVVAVFSHSDGSDLEAAALLASDISERIRSGESFAEAGP